MKTFDHYEPMVHEWAEKSIEAGYPHWNFTKAVSDVLQYKIDMSMGINALKRRIKAIYFEHEFSLLDMKLYSLKHNIEQLNNLLPDEHKVEAVSIEEKINSSASRIDSGEFLDDIDF